MEMSTILIILNGLEIGMSNQECEQINPDLIPFKINETYFKNVKSIYY